MSDTVRTEESSSKNSYGDPPKININLPEISEITQNFKLWKDVRLPIDILLLTVKDCEFLSCFYYIFDPFTSYCKGLGTVYFGSIGEYQDVKLKVALIKCSEGSKAPGTSLTVVKNAVTQLRPKAVFSVGHCSGINQETTKLGDVVISEKLTTHSYQKATKNRMEFHGVTTPVSRDIDELIKCAGYGWNAPLENPEERKVEVHHGEVLSGSELVQAEWRRNELVKSFPGAIAIETEGEGVYNAARDLKMEWVVVRGISGYADGRETEEKWKTFASVTAASLVVSILNKCSIFDDWPHYKEPSCSSAQSSHQQHASSAKAADISTDGQDLALSKGVPIETSCSSAQSFQNASSAKTADSTVRQILEWCQNQLREFYSSSMCQVKITPWDPDNTVHINKIYVQLTLLQDSREPHRITKTRLEDCSEVFEGDQDHPIRRRILVYGKPGIGKSTFTQKVAVDWANGKNEILRKFSLLLLIKLRDVCDIPDLCAMLKTAELLSADDPKAVNNLYEYVLQNQEKVLLILDGYDEYSGGKSSPVHQIWRGSQLRDCYVMITTRPVKEDELRMPSHAQFELNGLDSREQKEQFARKILGDEEDVEGFLDYLEEQDLKEMTEIPLLLLMLCLLWKEKKHQLPTSRAYIYVGFIQTLLDHMATKELVNVATGTSIDEYREELSKIGKLAYDALLEERLHFNFSKFAHGDLYEKLIAVGFFQVCKLSALNREKVVYFLHKSVQEFLAAWFIVQELTAKNNGTVTCLTGMDTFEKSTKVPEVLKFVCGLSSEAADIVFHHLQYLGEKEGLTNYKFTKTPFPDDLSYKQREFILLCVDCLFLCPASDKIAVYSAFLSCVNHVVLLGEEHTSTAAVEHFFKSISSFPNYLFFSNLLEIEDVHDDVLSIMLDLNAIILTSSGKSKDVKKYRHLLLGNSFLKKSGGRNFVYLIHITDKVFHSELLPELISAPVCSSQPPVDNLVNNENNNIALPFTENHCLSLVREVHIFVSTVKDAVLLKNVFPLLTAPRKIKMRELWEEEEDGAFKGQLFESAINGMNFTDNLHNLQLYHIHITAKCAAFISQSLRHSPNLLKLRLFFNTLHSGGSHLAENLLHVPQLTELVLWNVQMGEKECAALAASLKSLKKLEELDIGDNALGHGIIELAKSLNNAPNLTRLELPNTNMGEDEASALAHALKYVPELKSLSLRYNRLGRGVRDLVQHLSSVPKLATLFLEGVQMTRTEFEELCTAINERNIKVYTDYHVEGFSMGEDRRRLTTAELEQKGIRFREEPVEDDEDDEDDDVDDVDDDDDDDWR